MDKLQARFVGVFPSHLPHRRFSIQQTQWACFAWTFMPAQASKGVDCARRLPVRPFRRTWRDRCGSATLGRRILPVDQHEFPPPHPDDPLNLQIWPLSNLIVDCRSLWMPFQMYLAAFPLKSANALVGAFDDALVLERVEKTSGEFEVFHAVSSHHFSSIATANVKLATTIDSAEVVKCHHQLSASLVFDFVRVENKLDALRNRGAFRNRYRRFNHTATKGEPGGRECREKFVPTVFKAFGENVWTREPVPFFHDRFDGLQLANVHAEIEFNPPCQFHEAAVSPSRPLWQCCLNHFLAVIFLVADGADSNESDTDAEFTEFGGGGIKFEERREEDGFLYSGPLHILCHLKNWTQFLS